MTSAIRPMQPVHYAIEQNEPELAKKLIEAGDSATETSKEGLSPFEQAVLYRQLPLAEWLLRRNLAPLPPFDPKQAMEKITSLGREIYEWKKRAVAADANGLTPLHVAILSNKKEAAALLIKTSDPNARTAQGHTYLHFAAMNPDPEMMSLILSMPIDIAAKTSQSHTAMDYLAASRNAGAFFLLCHRGAHLAEKESALFFLFAMALKEQPALLTGPDLLLALTNAVGLALNAMIVADPHQRRWTSHAILFIQQFLKQDAVSQVPAAGAAPVAQFFSAPLNFALIKFRSMWEPWILHTTELSNAYLVGKNTIEKVGHCFASLKTRPFAALTALSVHLFNAGAELFALSQSRLNPLRETPDYEKQLVLFDLDSRLTEEQKAKRALLQEQTIQKVKDAIPAIWPSGTNFTLEQLSVPLVDKACRETARLKHPDMDGGSTAEYQKLMAACGYVRTIYSAPIPFRLIPSSQRIPK